jgi:diguanylate cyclase (GGDEF)-like protein/PAS domain S-box-containing protein
MYAVLGATNEAILHAKTPDDLYQRVCDAAVNGGNFLTAAVIIPDPDTAQIKVEAVSGTTAEQLRKARISFDEATVEGQGLVGASFRTRTPAISNDFLKDPRTQPWHAVAEKAGIAAAAAIPLLHEDRTIGILLFYSGAKHNFDDEIIKLLERMARNITFALNNFVREGERKRAEEALRASEEKYRSIIESIEDAYYEVDLQGNLVLFNTAFARIMGYSIDEMRGVNHRDYMTREVARAVYETFNEVYRTGISRQSQDWEHIHRDGSKVHVEGSVHLVRDASGKPIGFRGILRDVTARRQMEQALRESEARFRALTNLSSDWYWEQDAELRFTRMESRHANKDLTQHPLLNRRTWDTKFEVQAPGGWEVHRKLLDANEPYRDIIMCRAVPDAKPYYISISGEPVFDSEGRFVGYRGISREITDQKIAEERVQYLATHDNLTGLPNRMMFSHLLNTAITSARRNKRNFAVLFIDLDRFKFINDTLGHDSGDKLLQEITARFKQTLRTSDVIARLGGDEFVVLVQDIDEAEQAAVIARKMLSTAIQPFVLVGRECRVTASIGVTMFPKDGEDEQSLMKSADIAMYFAKEEGKNNFQFYSKDIKSQLLERLSLEANLRHALERNEFSLHYQAKLDLKKGTITGVEALLRWQNPELGSVSPVQFIPIAEETGLIVPIGKWVLRTACLQNIEWQRQGLPPIHMAVNLSVRQFADESLLDDIAAVLKETGMAPSLLELEITEGMVIHNPERATRLVTAIKQMGVRLAIDDFGTGYSSLGQLKHFPIDTLKVDRSFVRDIATNSGDRAIIKAIIAMSKTLNLTVVAEGVETIEQEKFLREHACDEMQGYYFSRPIPANDFAAFLRAHIARPTANKK